MCPFFHTRLDYLYTNFHRSVEIVCVSHCETRKKETLRSDKPRSFLVLTNILTLKEISVTTSRFYCKKIRRTKLKVPKKLRLGVF